MSKWKPGDHILDEVVERHLEAQPPKGINPQKPAVTDQNIQTREDVKESLGRTIEN